MSYLGTYQLGDLVPVSVWTVDSSGTPAEPDDAPAVLVMDSSGSIVDALAIPIVDRNHVTGFFQYRIPLDAEYSTGYWTVHVNYAISSTAYADLQTFEILAGGNNEGNGIALHMFKQPSADYVLLQTDHGRLKRLRNPSVRGI